MGGPLSSSEAALSGSGRRASRRRDAHTRRAGSLAETVGTTLPRKDRASASTSAQHSPVPDQLRGHWRPATKPLGLLRCRSDSGWLVQSSLTRPKPGSQFSAELMVHGTVAVSRLDHRCGDTVWSPTRALGRRALSCTAVLHQGRRNEPGTETQKGVCGAGYRDPARSETRTLWDRG